MDNREIMGKFFNFMHLHRQVSEEFMDGIELYHGQLPILEFIKHHPGCMQSEVAEGLHVSAPSITNSLKRMEANGLVKRVVDANDARRFTLGLSEKGMDISDKVRANFDRMDEKTIGNLSKEEQEQLSVIMDKLIQGLSKEEE